MRTAVAAIVALVAWSGLALQYWLIVERTLMRGGDITAATGRFLSFFTILTNGAVALVASAMVMRPGSGLAGPRVRLATATAILLVGIVYSIALRAYWQPTGWHAVADHALHDVTPPIFLIAWALSADGSLRWRDALWAIVGPLVYFAYALIRGAMDGWYAYWFLDPSELGNGQMAVNAVGLLAAFLGTGVVLVAADRWLGRRKKAG